MDTAAKGSEDLEAELIVLRKRAAELENQVKVLNTEPATQEPEKIVTKEIEEEVKKEETIIVAKDENSIYIGNLTAECTPEDLQNFFSNCGVINRITIMCNKFTGKPKGFAYMEFDEEESVEMAVGLNETELNGQPLVVTKKRKNVPKFILRRGRGRGRGRGGRARGRGRGRGRGRYSPY